MMPPRPAGDFVGREAELETIRSALDGGEGQPVVVVHGESGIGKTRTVTELARRLAMRGAQVLWGTCHEDGSRDPFAPWIEALSPLVEARASDRLQTLHRADVGALAELLPAIRRAFPDTPPAASLELDEGRMRLYEAVVRLLNATEHRAVVVLDDVHGADPATIDLLMHAVRWAPSTAIVLTYRTTALRFDDLLLRRLAEGQRSRRVEYVELARLDRVEAERLLAGVSGRPLDAALIERVYAESGGNPFFLAEMGRYLSRHEPGAPEWQVPPTVLGAVALRFARLTPETRRVLELASAFSAAFAFEELQGLAQLDDEALMDCLDEALSAELVRTADSDRYALSHVIVRNALRARSSSTRRARLHRRLAETLEHIHAADLASHASEIARQYQASASLAGAERGAGYALLAAGRARAMHAAADAVEFLRMALDLTRRDDLRGRARVLGELARHHAEAVMVPEARKALDAAVTLLEESDAEGSEIAALVYEVGSIMAVPTTSSSIRPLVARGLLAVGEEDPLARARLKLLERHGGQHGASVRWLNLDSRAVDVVRSQGNELDYARSIDPTAAWESGELERLFAVVQRWRDPAARLRALEMLATRIAITAPESPSVAQTIVDELAAIAEEVASPIAHALATMTRGAVLASQGRLAEGSAELSAARAMTSRWSRLTWLSRIATLNERLTTQHVMPDWEEMATTFQALAEEADGSNARLIYTSWTSYAYARCERADEARDLLQETLDEMARIGLSDSRMRYVLDSSAAAAWTLRDPVAAQALLPHAEAWVHTGLADPYMVSSDLTVARLLSVLGRPQDALEAFQRARGRVERQAQRPLRPIVDHDEAVMRRWHGHPGSEELMQRATARFERLGMTDWARRAAQFDLAPEPPDGLTRREVEILRLLAAGKTNKEIAGELVISVHTVERHVQNAYRKVGAHNRAEATAYAASRLP